MTASLDVPGFRTMISPWLLQFLFRGGNGGVLVGTRVPFSRDHRAWWIALVFGCLVTRAIFERAILAFQTCQRLNDIAGKLPEQPTGQNKNHHSAENIQ